MTTFDKPFAYGGFIPDASESRICFGIAWFTDERDADQYAAYIVKQGHAYNGGMFNGKACGRDKSFDFTRDGIKYHAVTH